MEKGFLFAYKNCHLCKKTTGYILLRNCYLQELIEYNLIASKLVFQWGAQIRFIQLSIQERFGWQMVSIKERKRLDYMKRSTVSFPDTALYVTLYLCIVTYSDTASFVTIVILFFKWDFSSNSEHLNEFKDFLFWHTQFLKVEKSV